MRCVICRTDFCWTTWSSPAEDCDCGANLRLEDIEDISHEDYAYLVNKWLEQSGKMPKEENS